MKNTFYSNGKLLITAEYLILDGAKGLALPTNFGQDLVVKNINSPDLVWESIDKNNATWFKKTYQLPDISIDNSNKEPEITYSLQNILREARKLNPDFLNTNTGFQVKTKLTFPRNWGLGSSSTLINNIAKWANINAFDLLKNSFGGSGYDIACAQNNTPILYQLRNNFPKIEKVIFDPVFRDQLYFIHLNQKQNSRSEIVKFLKNKKEVNAEAEEISQLTIEILKSSTLTDFENILKEHEEIIASIVGKQPIQEELFSDYYGQTKSLGAWGGDFILATGNEDTTAYFTNKGFETVIPYKKMIL